MLLDARQLKRHTPDSGDLPLTTPTAQPLVDPDLVILGAGNSAEAVTLRLLALAAQDGTPYRGYGLNNDALPPRPLTVRLPDDTLHDLSLTDRLVLTGDNPRDALHQHPLLVARYQALLRGIPVFETYPRAGHGGHGYPVISALDLDVQMPSVQAFLRQLLRPLRDPLPGGTSSASDWERLRATVQQRQQTRTRRRIVVLGSGSGSMGNAAHHLLPYLIRYHLADLGITSYDLWGVVLGPRAFTGLTPFVQGNYRVLLEALDEATRHGHDRHYLPDLHLVLAVPPYDRVFLLDDPHLPGAGTAVSETELAAFLDQAALSLFLLLRESVWATLASHIANPDRVTRPATTGPRFLHTVRGVLASADLPQITALLTAHLEQHILTRLTERLAP